ncbi:MAG: MmgE/PrpD family protein [Syntrophales bacterium]|nr:MmgE/PrpD family protein [Syntrophales bacterium]
MEQKITEGIADFVAKTSYNQLPQEAISAAKGCILDCLGVSLLGSREEASRIMIEYGRRSEGSPEATVWTGKIMVPASQTVLINGTMAHVLDYDDYSLTWLAHPTVAIFPAALAMAEKCHRPGRECLLAYILGVEVGGKLSAAFGNTHYLVGWHNTGTLGSIGAATASVKILNLDVKKIKFALGIGASLASGLRQNFGSMTKSLHAGSANRNGIVAAELAEAGFTSDENIIEAPLGFSKVFAGGKEQPLDGVPGSLGNPFEIVSPGLTIKPYPSCGGTHPMIYAMLNLKKEHDLSPSEVTEIECRASRALPNILIHHRPHQGLEGKFSMEFCLAAALTDGKIGVGQFTDESINRSEIQDLISRTKFVHPEDWSEDIISPQEVVVRLKDGREFSRKVSFADVPGSPRNPITWEEQCNKFRDCAQIVLPAKKINEIVELVLHFDELRDVNELTKLLT